MERWGRLEAGFETADGMAWRAPVEGAGARATVGGLMLDWRVASRNDLMSPADRVGRGYEIRLRVTNPSTGPVSLERLDVLRLPRGIPGGDLRVLQTGWQSWSMATPLVNAASWLLERPLEPPLLRPMLPPSEAERIVIPWMTVVATDRETALFGFAEAARHNATISVIPTFEGHALVASVHAEGHLLAPGASLEVSPLLVLVVGAAGAGLADLRASGTETPTVQASACDAEEASLCARLLAAYADEVARRVPGRPSRPPMTGWCSWYTFYDNVSEHDVTDTLHCLDRHGLDVEVVQVDHGYERVIGDWLHPSERFPSGMKALADRIHAAGRRAGIWVAPFMVGDRSGVAREHPDWLLRDAAGQPFVAVRAWGCNFALDITHPGAADWLRDVLRTLVDDWDYDYLKLDFLYAGCLRGQRHDPRCTSVEAYRRGMELIREAVGDRFIVGCGAPFLPSVGFVDAMRVSPDTAIHWADDDGHGTSPAMENAIRSNLAHGWMNRRWWQNDPDCLILQADLTVEELRTWATVTALSGGMLMLTDNLGTLDEPQHALLRRVLPPARFASNAGSTGSLFHAVGPFTRGLPARVEREGLVALFNWSAQPVRHDFEAHGHLFDCWSGEHWRANGRVDLGPTAPHGTRLLRQTPERDRAQVVGSTLHVLGGQVEVADERWDGTALHVTLALPGPHEGEIAISFPQQGLRRVQVRMQDHASISVQPPADTADRR